MPNLFPLQKSPQADCDQIYVRFEIRLKICDEMPLAADEASLWEDARSRAPEWAWFHRMVLSSSGREAREQVEPDCAQALDEIFAEATSLGC